MRIVLGWLVCVIMTVLLAAGCAVIDEPGHEEEAIGETESAIGPRTRSADLKNAAGVVVSRVFFVPIGSGKVLVSGTVSFPGIRAGFHGFHIHANDNPANGDGCIADPAQPPSTHFVSADGHWNPDAETHGEHAGDMPSLLALENGSGAFSFVNQIDPLSDVVGRAVILHEGADNFGNIPVGTGPTQYTANSPEAITLTQNTGNAGNRIGCGLIR